jgi:hypothetical protein
MNHRTQYISHINGFKGLGRTVGFVEQQASGSISDFAWIAAVLSTEAGWVLWQSCYKPTTYEIRE